MKFLLPALPLALLAIAAGAPAAGEQARSVRIVTRDLDLATPADARLLERRIGRALGAVCGVYGGGSFERMEEIDRCRKAARASMRPDPAALVSEAKRHPAQRVAAH
jgi:UrcA family protein